ncbi:MAG: hypothetical protein ACPLRH_00050 [Desulfotomaculales bacterium]
MNNRHSRQKTYDAGWATITIIHEPDPDRVMEGLLLLLRWRIEDLRKEGRLCDVDFTNFLPEKIERSLKGQCRSS